MPQDTTGTKIVTSLVAAAVITGLVASQVTYLRSKDSTTPTYNPLKVCSPFKPKPVVAPRIFKSRLWTATKWTVGLGATGAAIYAGCHYGLLPAAATAIPVAAKGAADSIKNWWNTVQTPVGNVQISGGNATQKSTGGAFIEIPDSNSTCDIG